jgi:FHS family L-fucose permease-like MFS transporter
MEKNNKYFVPFITVAVLFFMIGFALGINGLLIPYIRKSLQLSTVQSYYVLTATFSTFVIFGYPSGILLKKVGYKKTILTSFVFFILGMYLFIPSASDQNLFIFLLASFICGIGNTILQSAVNPYITLLGNLDSAATRISIMGIVNKLAWAIAPIFLGLFLDLNNVDLKDIILPFYIIIGIFLLLFILILCTPLPEIKAIREDEKSINSPLPNTKMNILQYPHLLLGFISLFCYVGVETLSMSSIVDYANYFQLPDPQLYTSFTVSGMILGYLIGILLIPKYLSQEKSLLICSVLGIISSCMILMPIGTISIYFVALLGLANSLLWPAIWPLAIKDLGELTKIGSSILVMAIAGGAIFPLLFGWMCDLLQNMQQAYWICIPAYSMILYYAIKGHKIRI